MSKEYKKGLRYRFWDFRWQEDQHENRNGTLIIHNWTGECMEDGHGHFSNIKSEGQVHIPIRTFKSFLSKFLLDRLDESDHRFTNFSLDRFGEEG